MKIFAFALLVALLPAPTLAQSRCPTHHLGGAPPTLQNPKLAARARPLCYQAFAVLHSGVSRTPLWVAERLTRASVTAAIAMEGRDDRFHPEPRLPPRERAELDDYRRSGFSRGHMAPSADMPTRLADAESFSLANIVPQARRLNQGSWAELEGDVRNMALTSGEAYVVTGPLFEGQTASWLKGRVLVPTSTWKAVYLPSRGAAVYVATNSNAPRWRVLSVAAFARLAGIDPFPALSGSMRERASELAPVNVNAGRIAR